MSDQVEYEPGLYKDISFPEYQKIDAVNASLLKHFKRSAAHARQAMLVPKEPTAALDLGHAVHSAVLEPELFKKDYVAAPKVDLRRTEDKQIWAKFCDEHKGKSIMKEADFHLCCAMRDSAWNYGTAKGILSGAGVNESVVIWRDKKTGILCKARPDRLTSYINWTVCADLKTTKNASEWSFSKDIHQYGWHVSAAFYLDGLQEIHPIPGKRMFVYIAIEKEPPYCPKVYVLDQASIEQGRKEYRGYLKQYDLAVKTESWSGYPQGTHEISIPNYGKQHDDVRIEGVSII